MNRGDSHPIILTVETGNLFGIRFLGGARGIGASCAIIEVEGLRMAIDCGVRLQGPLAGRLPDLKVFEDGPPPAAILVTHAHLDHIGALPVLSQRFPSAPVFATAPTIALLRIQLLDALKIMEAGTEAEGEMPLYSKAAMEDLLARAVPVKLHEPFQPVPGGPRATYFPAGHLLGASAIGLEGRAGRLLFTGDVSMGNQRTIPGMPVPSFKPQLVVSESTYGNRLHASRAAEEERLVAAIGETVAARGKVLVPAFAVGRAQEVILILIQAMLTRRLPPFPVHVDGLVRNVCQVYREFSSWLRPALKRRVEKFGDPFFGVLENVRPVAGQKRREEILDGPPCAIVASSGMLTGGASPIYARALAESAEHLIAITGYQDEESPGRRLLGAATGESKVLSLGGREVAVKCRVEKYALSAHADADELTNLLRALTPSDTLLVHGDDQAREELAARLHGEGLGRVHLPVENGMYRFELDAAPARPLVQAPPPAASPPPRKPVPPRAPRRREEKEPERMELDAACREIEEAFQELPHRPSRVAIHPRKEGPVIRLTFISAEVGGRYREIIGQLETETGWPLRVSPEADQDAIRDEARRLLDGAGKIRRGPRVLAREHSVTVELSESLENAEEIRRRFRERTGYELRLKSKDRK